jgi:hypothetical protein
MTSEHREAVGRPIPCSIPGKKLVEYTHWVFVLVMETKRHQNAVSSLIPFWDAFLVKTDHISNDHQESHDY